MMTAEPLGPVTDLSPLYVRIAAHYAAGATSILKTASLFGVTEPQVHIALEECGVAVRPQSHKYKVGPQVAQIVARARRGESARQIGRTLGIHRSTVLRVMREHDVEPAYRMAAPRSLTPERQARACALYLDGRSLEAVAQMMEVGEVSVHNALVAAAIPRRGVGAPLIPKFSTEVLDHAADLYAAGMTMAEIRSTTGVGTRTVHRAVDARGLPRRTSGWSASNHFIHGQRDGAVKMYLDGVTFAEIHAQTGIERSVMRREIQRRGLPGRYPSRARAGGTPVSPKQLARAVQMYADGDATIAEIAAKTGIGKHSVRSAIDARGMPRRSPGWRPPARRTSSTRDAA